MKKKERRATRHACRTPKHLHATIRLFSSFPRDTDERMPFRRGQSRVAARGTSKSVKRSDTTDSNHVALSNLTNGPREEAFSRVESSALVLAEVCYGTRREFSDR